LDLQGNFPSEYGEILKFKKFLKLKKDKTKPKHIKYMLTKLSREF